MNPGDLLASKYCLESVLGSGAMGKVWAAVNESTGRPVAIKLMHMATPELRTRMLREARAVGTLKHRNIVDLYDAGETENGDPFLVMERLSGETLEDRLGRAGRLSPARAIEVALSIAAALKVAHARGIVHRDLKPANVFLHREADGEGEIVKVLDFGVSKHLQKQEAGNTLTTGLVGSPPYMSPEQARAEPNIDARSDLWSFGVVLFQMLAGRRPFDSTSPYLVISDIVTGPIPSIAEVVPGLDPALVHVVARCLTRDVDARMGSAEELIRLLGAARDAARASDEEPTRRQQTIPPSSEPTTQLPLALAAAGAAPLPAGPGPGPLPKRGSSNAILALAACASVLSLIVVSAVALRRASATMGPQAATNPGALQAPPTAKTAIPAAPTEPRHDRASGGNKPQEPSEATTIVAPSIPPPVATTPPETSASAEPATPPRPPPPRTHPSGEKRLVLP